MSDEAFMGKLKSVSLLKVRGSYGMIGNNNIGNYTHYNTVSGNTNAVFLVVLSQAEVLLRILETMIWDGKKLANWTLESILVSSIIVLLLHMTTITR